MVIRAVPPSLRSKGGEWVCVTTHTQKKKETGETRTEVNGLVARDIWAGEREQGIDGNPLNGCVATRSPSHAPWYDRPPLYHTHPSVTRHGITLVYNDVPTALCSATIGLTAYVVCKVVALTALQKHLGCDVLASSPFFHAPQPHVFKIRFHGRKYIWPRWNVIEYLDDDAVSIYRYDIVYVRRRSRRRHALAGAAKAAVHASTRQQERNKQAKVINCHFEVVLLKGLILPNPSKKLSSRIKTEVMF
jgi:hypothetical protein